MHGHRIVGDETRGDAHEDVVGSIGKGPGASVTGATVADTFVAADIIGRPERTPLFKVARCGNEEGGRPADAPAHQAAVRHRTEAHFEINAFADQIRRLFPEDQLDRQAGMPLEKGGEPIADIKAEGCGQGEPDTTGDQGSLGRRGFVQGVDRFHYPERHRDHVLALGGKRQCARRPVKKARVQVLLESRYLPRDRRLRQVEIECCGGKRARLRHAQEGSQR
ncbi:hypothetical protein D9M72_405370 [compost metagenome]